MHSFRQIEKQDAENQIDGQKLHALKPIGFPVDVDLKNQMHGFVVLWRLSLRGEAGPFSF